MTKTPLAEALEGNIRNTLEGKETKNKECEHYQKTTTKNRYARITCTKKRFT